MRYYFSVLALPLEISNNVVCATSKGLDQQGEHSAIPSTFIELPIVIKIFVLSFFEWPFYTGLTVVIDPKVSVCEGNHLCWLLLLLEFLYILGNVVIWQVS